LANYARDHLIHFFFLIDQAQQELPNMFQSAGKLFGAALFFMLVTGSVYAQSERAPSKPLRPFVVMNSQSLADVEKKLGAENKAQDLIGGEGMQLRVAIQHEKDKSGSPGEVHDASDDVYYVTAGSAELILGGTLEAAKEVEPGEWRGARIVGGQKIEITKGDLVIVPRGTPHQRSTAGKDFTMILIKVFAEPWRS
jgi:mannose-6-phosphate isomerase-like protein (cupin superfamily)